MNRISLVILSICVFFGSFVQAQNKEQSDAFHVQGEMALNEGDAEKAIAHFRKAIEADSTSIWSYYYRGITYANRNQFGLAVKDYSRVLDLDPAMSDVYELRGIAFSQGVDYNKAVEDFKKASSFKPNEASLYNNISWCYLTMRKYEEAVEFGSKAIELNSDYHLAYNNRGWAYYQLGSYDKALSDLKKAMEIDPESPYRKDILDHYTKAAVAVESGKSGPPLSMYDLKDAGTYYALIIGNNEYQDDRLTPLDQPIQDATKLYDALTSRYTFQKENVIFLKNATRGNIIEAFDELNEKMTKSDNLIIFYAGHGIWDHERQSGYWLPVDAQKDKTTNWLRNSTIQGYIADIPSHHTLLIADACFGGGIFKTRRAFEDAPSSIENLYKLSSRKGMTSGMLNEVPDRSVFMEYLVKRLNENQEKYTTSLTLFTGFREAVMNNSNNAPQYGTIHNTGDEGGDFIFVLR